MWIVVAFLMFFLAFTGLGILAYYNAGTWLQNWARTKKKFFALRPPPGTFSLIKKGNDVVMVLENVNSWRLTDEGPNSKFLLEQKPEPDWFEKEFGVVWIGLFTHVFDPRDERDRDPEDKNKDFWEWPEIKSEKDSEGEVRYVIEKRSGSFPYFFFQYQYPVKIQNVEIKGNMRCTMTVMTTVWYLMPVRGVTLNKKPVDLYVTTFSGSLKSWMGEKDINELKSLSRANIKPTKEGETPVENTLFNDFSMMLDKLNGIKLQADGNPDYGNVDQSGLFGKMGIMVVTTEIYDITAEGRAQAALEQQEINKLEGDAEITKQQKAALAKIEGAKGTAEAMRIEADAKRYLLENTVVYATGGPGPHNARVLTAEHVASKDSDVTMWVEGGANVPIAIQPQANPPKKSE